MPMLLTKLSTNIWYNFRLNKPCLANVRDILCRCLSVIKKSILMLEIRIPDFILYELYILTIFS